MTLYKARASQQMAPSGGPGSFPTPVRGRGKRAEAPFKGGGEEEAVCLEEKKGKHGEEGEQWHSAPPPPPSSPFLRKRMKTLLSSLYSGVGLQWVAGCGLGEGRRGSGRTVFSAAKHSLL